MKITIKSIDNIPDASRLIITYIVNQHACSVFNGGAWDYLLEHCWIRTLCDDQCINMIPNEQHPEHSKNIQWAGEYKFVWDYGGYQNLNPSIFSNEYNYIVQLVLIDQIPDLNDPCDTNPWLTPSGEIVTGIPYTSGDIYNTWNNCGSGYIMVLDSYDCPKCQFVPPPSGNDPGGSEEYEPYITFTPTGPLELWTHDLDDPNVDNGGGDNTDPPDNPGPTDPDNDDNTGAGEPPNGGGSIGTPPWDVPRNVGPVTPGAPGPSSAGIPGDDGESGSPPTGSSGSSGEPPTTLDPSGFFKPSDDIWGKDKYFGELFTSETDPFGYTNNATLTSYNVPSNKAIGLPHGGLDASANYVIRQKTFNQLINSNLKDLINNKEDRENKNTAINLHLRSFSVTPNITINRLPNYIEREVSNPVRSSISVTGNSVYINSNIRNVFDSVIGPENNNTKIIKRLTLIREIINDQTEARLAVNGRSSRRSSIEKSIGRGSSTRDAQDNSKLRVFGRPELRKDFSRIANTSDFSLNQPDFNSNFRLTLFTSDKVKIGQILPVISSLYIEPKVDRTVRLSLYLIQNNRSYLIDATRLRTGSTPRRLSVSTSTRELKAGTAVVLAVCDDGTNILGTSRKLIKVLDSSTLDGIPMSKIRQSNYNTKIEALINSSSNISAYIGNNYPYLPVLCNFQSGVTGLIELAGYTKSNRINTQHSISVYDVYTGFYVTGVSIISGGYLQGNPIVTNIGNINIDGIYIPQQQQAGAIYKQHELSGISGGPSGNILFTIASISQTESSKVEFFAGKDLKIKDFKINKINTIGSNIELTVETPHPFTNFIAYNVGGNYIVPSGLTGNKFTTNHFGIGSFQISATTGSYVGLALENPSNVLLNYRLKGWLKI